jgi:Ca-activated chloride channel family protein
MTRRPNRRRLLSAAGGLAALLAGCAGQPPVDPDDDGDDDERSDPTTTSTTVEKVDDWQYDPRRSTDGSAGAGGGGPTQSAGNTAQSSVGLATGGAKDAANFRQNVEEGYLPLPTDVSYEGLFYDYYFETGDPGRCSTLFCPTAAPATTPDPLSGETERYVSVGLNSGLDEFERPPLDLVVTMDVSGSMSAQFDEYYYDRFGNRQEIEREGEAKTKVEIAREVVASMTERLRPDDRFGMVVYESQSSVAKPLREVERTDMAAIRGHIRELEAGGGTRLSAGLDDAVELLAEVTDDDETGEREHRTIVLTDAMPNLGDTDDGGLQGRLESAAERDVHATFVGVGVDFNTELVDAITAVRGANYYSVHSERQFEERLNEEFRYMVTPLAYDLSVELRGESYEIEQVYGSSAAEDSTADLLRANTLFPSPTEDGRTRGGVILAKLASVGTGPARLVATWENRDGSTGRSTARFAFPDGEATAYAGGGVRKAVLLTRYADLLKSWTVDQRERAGEPETDGIRVPDYPERRLGEWERQSRDLAVSEAYRERFREFLAYFRRERQALGDDRLEQEVEVLERLASDDPSTGRVVDPLDVHGE